MSIKKHTARQIRRRCSGSAAVEMALMLPLLVLIAVVATDFARLYFHYNTIVNCARNGALYASDPFSPLRRTYSSFKKAAVADGQSLNPPLDENDVTLNSGSDADGAYAEVTVKYKFVMATSYLGFGSKNLTHTVRMRMSPRTPD